MSDSSPSAAMSLPCMLCGRNDDCTEKYGEKKTYKEHNLTLHYYCLLLSSGIWQRGNEDEGIYGFLVSDIKKEFNRARKLKCCVCKGHGASIGCVFPRCKRGYHFPCGSEKQCIFQFMDIFSSYCWEHRPVQKPLCSQSNESSLCTICLENIDHVPSYHVIRGPCCKTSWYHRDCLQYQALSAGLFFFRCTVCNNREVFQKEMLRLGIHIPERDASWELEENAFQELLVRHQRCDVEKCLCRNGRDYNIPDSKWEIVRCQSCGSSGTHIACSSVEQVNQTWECAECQSISCSPVKRSRPASLNWSETLDDLGFDTEQPSPKCRRRSRTSRQVILKQVQRHISDILKELKSPINKSIFTVKVQSKSVLNSSLIYFRKMRFSPYHTLQIKFTNSKGRVADISLPNYFKLLLDAIQNSNLFEGSERKNLSLNVNALEDDLYYEAGRMVAISLVHGGPAPSFFSPTLFYCLIYDSHLVQPMVEDVTDPNVLQAVLKIQSCQRINELKAVTAHYFDYLQNTGTLRLVQTVSDKSILVKNILAYHVIRRVQGPLERFKEGLKTLGVLENIQTYPTAFWSVLCMTPEKLTAKMLSDLFTITYHRSFRQIQQCNAINLWEQYLEDTEDGATAVSLENILNFTTGVDLIPPAGFEPRPTILFHYGHIFPTASRNTNSMELPGNCSYEEFRNCMDKAIRTTLNKG
ncbi:G2/M phase-specific E3 ubiquitin-protein ligase isoform X2 [Bufo gargarizans]|nr:G2/M phase-specific E3 ubiquitin-protein ligase isoform X2 [Bufo gargarizans]XP_044128435.1 G2/M phase-specific E3 ubiquitin-protein ligase isoform X2 [Bufo gargarizans]XP_044128437.1 G2/M phase-specific E3 ubiquitin-protein ligase isoform X2 [Bufo gargarizans]